jgi:hypothetical protein
MRFFQILDAEVAGFPSRASGEQGYEYINKIAARYVTRNGRSWLLHDLASFEIGT